MTSKITVLYRYDGYDKFAIEHPMELYVHRETEHFYWVDVTHTFHHSEKRVAKAGMKRYAYPTKERALRNYKARKRSQIEHCARQIRNAEKGLFCAGESVKSILKDEEHTTCLE
jgi:hypothetical protein